MPLLVGVGLHHYSWAALVVSVFALGVLGTALATAVGGRRPLWIAATMLSVGRVAVIGTVLNIA